MADTAAITRKEYDELNAAGLSIGSAVDTQSLLASIYARGGFMLVDPNRLAEHRAKLKELKSTIGTVSTPEAQDPRRARMLGMGGATLPSAYSLLTPTSNKGNTLLG